MNRSWAVLLFTLVLVAVVSSPVQSRRLGSSVPEYCQFVRVDCNSYPFHECCGRRQAVPEFCNRTTISNEEDQSYSRLHRRDILDHSDFLSHRRFESLRRPE
ncbi:hypothetical protein Hamer_G021511 [Homarus americanus]|uniref:Uncharacterized protein n=1 Tax=Homarus americanus TaxID=6706 RepID=A0A8J5K6V6_HOMAM|nr:hypothetical protein Hamer_G021511 [Homarus americanus]